MDKQEHDALERYRDLDPYKKKGLLKMLGIRSEEDLFKRGIPAMLIALNQVDGKLPVKVFWKLRKEIEIADHKKVAREIAELEEKNIPAIKKLNTFIDTYLSVVYKSHDRDILAASQSLIFSLIAQIPREIQEILIKNTMIANSIRELFGESTYFFMLEISEQHLSINRLRSTLDQLLEIEDENDRIAKSRILIMENEQLLRMYGYYETFLHNYVDTNPNKADENLQNSINANQLFNSLSPERQTNILKVFKVQDKDALFRNYPPISIIIAINHILIPQKNSYR